MKPLLLALLAVVCTASAEPVVEPTLGAIAQGSVWETGVVSREAGDGPTILVLGGVHGNEPAGWRAARQIAEWPIVRGRLVVVPRTNELGCQRDKRRTPVGDSTIDLNRSFESKGELVLSNALERDLWKLISDLEPDWIVDLHESRRYRSESDEGLGNTVIVYPEDEALAVAAELIEPCTEFSTAEKYHWQVLEWPIEGSIVRAACKRLGSKGFIAETCKKGSMGRRVRYHRLLVHGLLSRLGMLPEGFSADTFFNPGRERPRGQLRVALYNDVGAPGAFAIEKCFRESSDVITHRITGAAIRGGALAQFDAIVFPGGSGSGQAESLREEGREVVRRFIGDGGGCIGVCAGAYLASAHYSWSLDVLDAKVLDTKHWARGKGPVDVALTREARKLFGEKDDSPTIRYAQGPLLAPGGHEDLPDYEVLGKFLTEVKKKGVPGGVMPGTDAIARGTFGNGRVMAFSPHPESSEAQQEYIRRALRWVVGQ